VKGIMIDVQAPVKAFSLKQNFSHLFFKWSSSQSFANNGKYWSNCPGAWFGELTNYCWNNN